VAPLGKSWGQFRIGIVLLGTFAFAGFCAFLWFFRRSYYLSDPLFDAYLEMAGSLIAFTFAANAMVRFRGTHDRISLILAFGFVLAGLIEAGSSVSSITGCSYRPREGANLAGWLAGRTLLGVLLLAALIVERRIPVSRDPGKEIAGVTLIVGAVAYLTSVFYFMLPRLPKFTPGHSYRGDGICFPL